MNSFSNNFAQTLKVARADRNLSQNRLAEDTGLSQVTLSNIENGLVRPYRSTREKVERVLGKIDWERTFTDGVVHRKPKGEV